MDESSHVSDSTAQVAVAANSCEGFCHDHALILYVYLPSDNDAEESVLTVWNHFHNMCF